MKFKKVKRRVFKDLPHLKTIVKLKLRFNDLTKRIKGRIRLLEKYIDLALRKGTIQEEEESFYAFSERIAHEIKQQFQNNGIR